jgi:indolepyruvate ferredoxin oxidoreductase alpha subunit
MCVACPHLGVYYTLSQLRNVTISGDIGCYTLGAGHPWNALDTCISMGASMGMALGLDKGRSDADKDKKIVAVIGDSTFLHMGMQGLLDIVYNRGNVTVLLLDNRAVGMTGGQDNPAAAATSTARKRRGRLRQAGRGARRARRSACTWSTPTSCRCCSRPARRDQDPRSLGDHHQPALRADQGLPSAEAVQVIDDKCTGCGNCIDVGCPAIHVTRRDKVTVKPAAAKSISPSCASRARPAPAAACACPALRAGCDRPCRYPGMPIKVIRKSAECKADHGRASKAARPDAERSDVCNRQV